MAVPTESAKAAIRPASRDDLGRILDIYNHAVLHSTATSDRHPNTLEKRTAWFDQLRALDLPILVAEAEEGVAGWASLNPYSPKDGYRFTADVSVYVAPEAQGKGIGTKLLAALVDAAQSRQLHSLVASIDASNAASIGLHEKFGFQTVACYRELMFKFDRWLDVVHMQKML